MPLKCVYMISVHNLFCCYIMSRKSSTLMPSHMALCLWRVSHALTILLCGMIASLHSSIVSSTDAWLPPQSSKPAYWKQFAIILTFVATQAADRKTLYSISDTMRISDLVSCHNQIIRSNHQIKRLRYPHLTLQIMPWSRGVEFAGKYTSLMTVSFTLVT